MNYRLLWAGAVAGLALHVSGLAWDVYRHSQASHITIVAGLAVISACMLGMAAVWMREANFAGSGTRGTVVRSVALPAIALIAAGTVWLGSRAEDSRKDSGPTIQVVAELDHNHAATATDGTSAVAATSSDGHNHTTASTDPAVAASGAAAAEPSEGEVMGDGSAHTHGSEVTISASQVSAASAFITELKAHTAQYQDVRAALADGYVQITQDLPGIAAHFIRLDYQHDGHEMDPDRPEVLLYTKRLDGQWRLVGAMMLAESVEDNPPSYFGALDSWHYHSNLCFVAGAAVKVTASAADCKNGLFVPRTPWQMHVWLTGQDDAVFAHDYKPISPGAFPGATRPAAEDFRVQAR
jgi:hypothetical protein